MKDIDSEQKKREYIDKYQKEHIRRVVVKLNDLTERDIIDYLYNKKNRQGYIKDLIKADMKKSD